MGKQKIFTKRLLDRYRNNPKIQETLRSSDISLMNQREFDKWFHTINLRRSPRGISSPLQTATEICQLKQANQSLFLTMVDSVAKGNIKHQYGADLLNTISNYDFLVAVRPSACKKMKNVIGFIIVHNNTCSLICVRPNSRFKSAILMGAYLFSLFFSFKGCAILELASGYCNIAGFKTYSRFGFKKDLSLFENGSFDDFDNLPMSVNLDTFSNVDQIIDIVVGKMTLYDTNDETGLLHLPKPTTEFEDAVYSDIMDYGNLLYRAECESVGDVPQLRDKLAELIHDYKHGKTDLYNSIISLVMLWAISFILSVLYIRK